MARMAQSFAVGEKFGQLTVISDEIRVGPSGNRRAAYLFRCDCGTEKVIAVSKIQGGTQSCGCARKGRKNPKSRQIEVGTRFRHLVVVSGPEWSQQPDGKRSCYRCECDCGNLILVSGKRLLSSNAVSCGCLYERSGQSETRLYIIWTQMLRRCSDSRIPQYIHYGGRGISVCDEWSQSFVAFVQWAESAGYADELTIERVDVNGNYEPSNCTWIPRSEQSKNRQFTKRVTAFGETKTLADWSRDPRCRVNYYALYARIYKSKWDAERAITSP